MADFSFKPNLDFGASLGPIKTPGDGTQGRWVKKWIANPSASTPLDPGGHWIRVEEPDFDPFTDFGGRGHGTPPNTGGGSEGYSGGGKNRNERDIYIRTPIDRGRGDIPPQELTEEQYRDTIIQDAVRHFRWLEDEGDIDLLPTSDNNICSEEAKKKIAAVFLDFLNKLESLSGNSAAIYCLKNRFMSGKIGFGCQYTQNHTWGILAPQSDGVSKEPGPHRPDETGYILDPSLINDPKRLIGAMAQIFGMECGLGSDIEIFKLFTYSNGRIVIADSSQDCARFSRDIRNVGYRNKITGVYEGRFFNYDPKTGNVTVPPSTNPVFTIDCNQKLRNQN